MTAIRPDARRRSILGLTLALLYGCAALGALGIMLWDQSAFRGVYLIMVTVPWSLLALSLLDHVWSPAPVLVVDLSLLLCAAVNGLLLYAGGAVIESFVRRVVGRTID
jgi:hypothetical protein